MYVRVYMCVYMSAPGVAVHISFFTVGSLPHPAAAVCCLLLLLLLLLLLPQTPASSLWACK
jgi:hypothetical protein